MWNFVKEEIETIISRNVPSKTTTSRHHQPWINTETKRIIRKKNRWLQKANQSKDKNVWKTYKKIKSQSQKACRRTHNQYLNSIFENDQSNKKLYSYIKNRKQENIGIPDLKSKNDLPIRDPVKKAQLIHQQFDSVFSDPSPPIHPNFEDNDKKPSINPIQITAPGIKKTLGKH